MYLGVIGFLQWPQFPPRTSHEITGMFSYQYNFSPQQGAVEPGHSKQFKDVSASFRIAFGSRWITTFRKLPKISPSTDAAKISIKFPIKFPRNPSLRFAGSAYTPRCCHYVTWHTQHNHWRLPPCNFRMSLELPAKYRNKNRYFHRL